MLAAVYDPLDPCAGVATYDSVATVAGGNIEGGEQRVMIGLSDDGTQFGLPGVSPISLPSHSLLGNGPQRGP